MLLIPLRKIDSLYLSLTFKVLLILLALVNFTCIPKENKIEDGNRLVLFVELLQPVQSPSSACSDVINSQVNCFKSFCERNIGFESFCLEQILRGIGYPQNLSNGGSSTETCNNTLSGQTFRNMSSRSQTCILLCQKADWNTKINSNECKNSSGIDSIFKNTINPTINSCIRNCFQTTNNQPNDSEISKYLIYNTIQQEGK